MVRSVANKEFESFVQNHIRRGRTFAIETTLRGDITFQQAHQASEAGFETVMHYLALSDVLENVDRVRIRADAGGHSAPESKLREIYRRSIRNLPVALENFERVRVYDNSLFKKEPRLLLVTDHGRVSYLVAPIPEWLKQTLKDTLFEL